MLVSLFAGSMGRENTVRIIDALKLSIIVVFPVGTVPIDDIYFRDLTCLRLVDQNFQLGWVFSLTYHCLTVRQW